MSQFVADAAPEQAATGQVAAIATDAVVGLPETETLLPTVASSGGSAFEEIVSTGASMSDSEENEDEGCDLTDVGSEAGTDSECDEEQALHPNFYDWEQVYGDLPALRTLRDSHSVVLAELERLEDPMLFNWPEQNLYDGVGEQWKVLPFLYTFPGNDPTKSVWMDRFCEMCPETTKLLRAIPGIRTALFSRMGPQTRLSAHRGWADLANHVLRLHLGLRIPHKQKSNHRKCNDSRGCACAGGVGGSGDCDEHQSQSDVHSDDHTCGLWVRGEKRYHRAGEIICFDDSKLHKAFNNHPSENRSVLIFDIVRPSHLPLGSAQKGHTDALDGFIAYFR